MQAERRGKNMMIIDYGLLDHQSYYLEIPTLNNVCSIEYKKIVLFLYTCV